ncbi:MAG: HesA/MoeB/ThiF family protein [Bacteroidales bacterium]|nr:HesA/MoeB/ThiF family protein [Bacteroidales bacterium]
MLSKNEKIRYHRQLILPGFGTEAQIKLRDSKVLVVGAGGLGSPVLLYLAAAGVGKIGIVDDDFVDVTNLQRQVLYFTKEIGQIKTLVAQQKLQNLNPDVAIECFVERLNEGNAEKIIKDFDLVVDCPDNLGTRFLVSDVTAKFKIPHIYGAIHQFEGHVSVFNYKNAKSYRNIFHEEPKERQENESDKGVLGVLPGIIGTIMANETIKVITGIGQTLSGRLLIVNTLDMSFQEIDL